MPKPKKYVHRGRVDFIEEVPQKEEAFPTWMGVIIIFFGMLLLAQCGG